MLPLVAIDVETHEQAEEQNVLPQDDASVNPRVTTVHQEGNAGVGEQYHKLNQLKLCQVSLPPQVLLNCGTEER